MQLGSFHSYRYFDTNKSTSQCELTRVTGRKLNKLYLAVTMVLVSLYSSSFLRDSDKKENDLSQRFNENE
jgi:hypothetical protein